jgi:hypothetical protein
MIKEFIPATRIVRAVLRKHGVISEFVFTNDYKKCKTVKTYVRAVPNIDDVYRDIRSCLIDAGITGYTIKDDGWSLIVRLPKE